MASPYYPWASEPETDFSHTYRGGPISGGPDYSWDAMGHSLAVWQLGLHNSCDGDVTVPKQDMAGPAVCRSQAKPYSCLLVCVTQLRLQTLSEALFKCVHLH